MYNIIPLILILISLTVIIIIIVKKFPALANLDVNNMPKEKEAKFKEQIISGRLKRNIIMQASKSARFIKPALEAIGNFFKWSYNQLHELKESYKSEEKKLLSKSEIKTRVEELFGEFDQLVKEEKNDEAEKKLIEIINLDNKSVKAFRALGELYRERKDYIEAKQTFEHVLRLEKEESGETYFDLALVGMDAEDFAGALFNINKALEIEPNNPRYLDTLFEISIINKDKASAIDAYKRLKTANPENQKLGEMNIRINEI